MKNGVAGEPMRDGEGKPPRSATSMCSSFDATFRRGSVQQSPCAARYFRARSLDMADAGRERGCCRRTTRARGKNPTRSALARTSASRSASGRRRACVHDADLVLNPSCRRGQHGCPCQAVSMGSRRRKTLCECFVEITTPRVGVVRRFECAAAYR